MITFKRLFRNGKTFTAGGVLTKEEEPKKKMKKSCLPPVDPPSSIADNYIGLTEDEIKHLHPDAVINRIVLDNNVCLEVSLSSDLLSCVIDNNEGKCKSAYIF